MWVLQNLNMLWSVFTFEKNCKLVGLSDFNFFDLKVKRNSQVAWTIVLTAVIYADDWSAVYFPPTFIGEAGKWI